MATVPDRKTTVRLDRLTIQMFAPNHDLPACCIEHTVRLLDSNDAYQQLCGVGFLARLEPAARTPATAWADQIRSKQLKYLEEQFISCVNDLVRRLKQLLADDDTTLANRDVVQVLLDRDQIASAQWALIAAGSAQSFEKINAQLGEAFSAAIPKLKQSIVSHHTTLFHSISTRDTQAHWLHVVTRPRF